MGSFSGWHWLIVAAIGVWVWTRVVAERGAVAREQRAAPRARQTIEPVYDWPSSGNFDGEVVGESNYQPALRALAGAHGDAAANAEHWAVLLPEDDNRYDSNAVRIEIGGQLVGYLSREDAVTFRDALREQRKWGPTRCKALVMGGFAQASGSRASYGVRLDLEAIT